MAAKRDTIIVTVNDRMQSGYRYALTRADGPRLRPRIQARVDAQADAGAGRLRRQIPDRLPRRVSRRLVRPGPPGARAAAMHPSTISGSTPASPCRYGAPKAGFTPTIRAAGSSGIAAISWAGAWTGRMPARSGDGRRCGGICARSSAIAIPAISPVAAGNVRPCCIGPTTAAGFSPRADCECPVFVGFAPLRVQGLALYNPSVGRALRPARLILFSRGFQRSPRQTHWAGPWSQPQGKRVRNEQSHRYRSGHHQFLRRHHGRQERQGDRECGRARAPRPPWSPSPNRASDWSARRPSARR